MKCIIYDDNLSNDQKFLLKGLELKQKVLRGRNLILPLVWVKDNF